MPPLTRPPAPKPAPTCKACKDTGKNSKGGVCYPCLAKGRIKQS